MSLSFLSPFVNPVVELSNGYKGNWQVFTPVAGDHAWVAETHLDVQGQTCPWGSMGVLLDFSATD